MNRRAFLRSTGLGAIATGTHAGPLAPKPTHFPARAKRVILLFMEGGPSQVDLIDYKPELIRFQGKPIPASFIPKKTREGKGEPLKEFGALKGPISVFRQRGQSGQWISDLMPHIAGHADDMCILNGMLADSTEHGTATQQLHTGLPVLRRPSMGAWLLHGLGAANPNLPGFVIVSPPAGSTVNCGTDFLPDIYQSTILRDTQAEGGDAIQYLVDDSLPRELRRQQLDFLRSVNESHAYRTGHDPLQSSLIEANELAFRMQTEAPEVLDYSTESDATRRLYGIGEGHTDAFGRQCLVARRLAEAGVRFIQVTSKEWDHHRKIDDVLPRKCRQVDQPIAGLLTDLKQRGLLEDTLLIWCGEFGRTPVSQGVGDAAKKGIAPGRGHNPFGWSLWMAGGGVKPGLRYGATDELGYSSVMGRVHIHDLHATILHLLGMDHERHTYRHAGRDYRLTDLAGRVVEGIVS